MLPPLRYWAQLPGWYRHWKLVVLFWHGCAYREKTGIIPFTVSVFWGLFWDVVRLTAHLIQHIPVRNMFQVRALLSPLNSIPSQNRVDAWQCTKGARKAGCNIWSPNGPGKRLGIQGWVERPPQTWGGIQRCREVEPSVEAPSNTPWNSLEMHFSLGVNIWFLSC